MSKGKNAAKAAQNNAGANGAAETTTANTGANVETNVNEGTEGEGTEGEGAEGTQSGEGADKAPETAAPVAPIKATKKQPPLKNGKRGGGARGARTGGKPTYNFAEAAYGDITGFLRHILSGCYVPVFNGHPGKEVDPSMPVYKTLEEAAKANAVEFGYRSDLPHFIGYKQNIQLAKAGCTQFTSLYKPGVYAADGAVITEPVQSYHSFLTATSLEDVAKAKQHLADYEALPWNANQKSMVSKWLDAPYALTFPAPAATLGAATAAPAAESETEKA
jgi:hypothetical protein